MAVPVLESVTTIIDQLANGISVSAKVSMRYETLRLCTFRNYPINKPFRIKLAKAGFYYASNDDEVICYCCAKRVGNWRESEHPMNAHRLMAPNCSYL
ncbi:hypothetical protein DPMN_138784 [Dreissena polymorpha]|uniref:Uncharacterized protein n=1 Tax=Dreissena polymorpha TaxID=45954 RepID=A0A9D4GAE1_DREPO|nr:hypothetical protein DPMN_138784 [Dreissena polymorpha]